MAPQRGQGGVRRGRRDLLRGQCGQPRAWERAWRAVRGSSHDGFALASSYFADNHRLSDQACKRERERAGHGQPTAHDLTQATCPGYQPHPDSPTDRIRAFVGMVERLEGGPVVASATSKISAPLVHDAAAIKRAQRATARSAEGCRAERHCMLIHSRRPKRGSGPGPTTGGAYTPRAPAPVRPGRAYLSCGAPDPCAAC